MRRFNTLTENHPNNINPAAAAAATDWRTHADAPPRAAPHVHHVHQAEEGQTSRRGASARGDGGTGGLAHIQQHQQGTDCTRVGPGISLKATFEESVLKGVGGRERSH